MNPEERVTYFAFTDARGKRVPFGIKAKDRTRHVYVIGKTGMGKSTLLENMAIQDLQNGEGLAFIDPHGSTAEKLLDYVPEHRINDVLYFAPFDTEYPVAFNVMEDVGPARRHFVASGLMSAFKKIWVDAWSPRMEYILTNTLLALLEYPDSTLLGANRMFSDKAYRQRVVDNISDTSVRAFWKDEFANYTERFAAEATPAIQNKVGQYTSNPLIRNIIGQPKSSFDIRKMMDEKKIIIMNLAKGLVGETNTSLLGSMLTTRLYLAALSRADVSAQTLERLPNFYFFVDEFQSFANASFADILAEARKYKLNLTIAHQYVEQMEEEVRDAVFGNVGTTIAFRVGPLDAELMEKLFAPKFVAADLVSLGRFQMYLTLMIDGVSSEPFSAVSMPRIEAPERSFKEEIIAASRRQFGNPKAAVEAAIAKWYEPLEGDGGARGEGRKGARDGQRRSENGRRDEPRPTGSRWEKEVPYELKRPADGPRPKHPAPQQRERSPRPQPQHPPLEGSTSLREALARIKPKEPQVPQETKNRGALRDALASVLAQQAAAPQTSDKQPPPPPSSKTERKEAGPSPEELRAMLEVKEE